MSARSHNPDFRVRLEDIVGPYLAPPCHAVVLSVDESYAAERTDRKQAWILPIFLCGRMI